MSVYAKAIAAAVIGALGTAAIALQAFVSDDSITSSEWVKVAIAFVTALASTAGVYGVANRSAVKAPEEGKRS
jgi:hypothetical protein